MISTIKNQAKQISWLNQWVYSTLYHWQTDCYVISYPKSGRTWLRTMMGYALADHFNLQMTEYEPALIVKKYGKPAPYIRFRHAGSGLTLNEFKKNNFQVQAYKNKKTIYLVRDPRDVLASFYFHRTHRLDESHDVNEFIEHDDWGIGRQLDFVTSWLAQRQVPKSFLLVRYEDLLSNAFAELQRIFSFLPFAPIEQSSLHKAVDYASFDSMKQRAMSTKNGRLRPTNLADPNSHKVRQGKVGGHKQLFSTSQIEFINKMIQEQLPSELGYPIEDPS